MYVMLSSIYYVLVPCGEKQAIEGSHVGWRQLYRLAVVVLRLQQQMPIHREKNVKNIFVQTVSFKILFTSSSCS